MYLNEVGAHRQLLGSCKGKVKEDASETGVGRGQVFKQAVWKCFVRGGVGCLVVAVLLGHVPRKN